jgi:formylglycine-generating enzyme
VESARGRSPDLVAPGPSESPERIGVHKQGGSGISVKRVLLLPMIAAWVVVASTADATGIVDPAVAAPPSLEEDVPAQAFDGGRCAKGAGTVTAKPVLRNKSKRKPRARPLSVASRQPVGRIDAAREAIAPALVPRERTGACPVAMVPIRESVCIDVYEASLVQVLPGGQERPWPFYELVTGDAVVRAVSVGGVYPQGYISGLQAREACGRSGKRLCKPDEWRAACMGPKATVFPYGNVRQVGRCNDNGRSSMRFFNPGLDGTPAHRWMWGFAGNMVDPRLNQLEGTLTRTGERAGCTNEYGVFDMVGNLHEWVDDPEGTFQGGYYLDTHLNGDGCNYRTTAHPMSHMDYSTGFRCCADS